MDSRTKVLAAGAAGLAAGLVVERLRRKPKDVTGRHDARVIVVLGAQWGDEGKGKLVDVLAGRADVVARFPGASLKPLADTLERFHAFHDSLNSISARSSDRLERVVAWLRG